MNDKINPKSTYKPEEEDDDESGDAGSTGGAGAQEINFESWIPGFNDFLQAPIDQKSLREFYEQVTLEQRLAAKAKGIDVQALNKKQQLKAQDNGNYIHNDGGGNNAQNLGFDEHPFLTPQDGMIDPSIVIPSNSNSSDVQNNPELKNSLKFGMSMQALREELKNKQKYRNEPEQPRYRPRSPKPRPF